MNAKSITLPPPFFSFPYILLSLKAFQTSLSQETSAILFQKQRLEVRSTRLFVATELQCYEARIEFD